MLPVAEALRLIDIDRSYLDINGSELFGEAFLNGCSSSVTLSRLPSYSTGSIATIGIGHMVA
jgi:hypothetical protein